MAGCKEGPNKCFVSKSVINSDFILDQTLEGKIVMFRPISIIKQLLTKRVREKKKCGFHIARSSFETVPIFMVFNKNFNREMKEKIRLK